MRGFLTIYVRELRGLAIGLWSWVLLAIALGLNAFFFLAFLKEMGGDVDDSLRFTLGGSVPYWAFMVFFPPLLTMRMISEESRSGMLEFLLTAPVSDGAVVCGKLLAATTFMAVRWGSVLLYALTLGALGTSPDWGPVLGGYLGSVLTSGLFCGVGILASASTNTPLLAAFLAFIANLFILLLPLLGSLTEASWLHALVTKVDVIAHFQKSFLVGVFDTAQVSFFLCWTALFVFFAVRLVETRRWR
jgi:ABC-2 type transport system permease protein